MTFINKIKFASRATRLFFLAFGLGISSWAPMVPYVKIKLAIDESELGMILFVFGLGALTSMPLAGYFIHKWGTRFVSLISAMLVLIVLPFLAISNTVFAVCAILFLFGIATGTLNVAINSQAVSVESKAKISLMSGFHCLFSLGGLFGALIISTLLEIGHSLLFCTLAVSLFISIIIFSQWKNLLPASADHRSSPQEAKRCFPGYHVLYLGIICFISFMAEGSMLDWSAEYLSSSSNYDPAIASIGFAFFSIAMACGRFFGDKLIKKWGAFLTFQSGSLIAASGFLCIVFVNYGHLELLGFFLIGLGASNMVPILFSSAGKMASHSTLAIVTSFGYVGMLVGPAFIGFIAEASTLSWAFISLSFLLVLVGLSARQSLIANFKQMEKLSM